MQESDGKLLEQYARHRDEASFEALAGRHLGLIFHVALRRTGNRQLAEEVSQNVLCAVARKAKGLARHPERLSAWLHRATLFESSKAMRAESSHQRRKQLQHPDEATTTALADDSKWAVAAPHLDQALDRLPESDRQVLLQHYFEGKTFPRIGEQLGKPAATVQKQCRRAIDKLARMLRGKGVAIAATTLASGLGTQFARAAPAGLLKTVSAPALAGSASYSTTQLSLFMAMKSKAVVPVALLVLAMPLALQQFSISRASSRNEELRRSLAVAELPRRSARVNRPARAETSGRVTIDQLHRLMVASHRGDRVKDIELFETIGSLDADPLVALIEQSETLHAPQQERRRLVGYLVGALTEIDPERAVRELAGMNPNGVPMLNVGAEHALYRWANEDPGAAIAWFEGLARGGGHPSMTASSQLEGALLCSLIEARSPRVREVMAWNPEVSPGQRIRAAMSPPTPRTGAVRSESAAAAVERVDLFIPWIREYGREEDARFSCAPDDMLRRLLSEVHTRGDRGVVPEMVLETLDLTPAERRTVAEFRARQLLADGYGSGDGPGPREAEAAAREWLEDHAPAEADEIFAEVKGAVVPHEQRDLEHRLSGFEHSEQVRDSDLDRELRRRGVGEFPELLDRAIAQARRVKDPVKRRELIDFLEDQSRQEDP